MKENILIVDDEELLLSSYQMYLEDRYDVTCINNAEEALKLLEKKSNFSVVISDYDLGGINGVNFLNKVKEIYPDIIRILMTAYNDVSIVSEAVNKSNIFRFIIKSYELENFDTAIEDAIELHRIIKSEKKLKLQLENTNKKLENDLKAAAKLQQEIQPKPINIEGYSFDSLFLPSVFLSGDNFNYFQFDDYIFFYVLDVTGSGIPASMLSFAISKLLNSDKLSSNPLLEYKNGKFFPKSCSNILKTLNELFLTKGDDLQFFTISFGIIDLKKNVIQISSGGNRRPILVEKQKTYQLDIKGMPIGIIKDFSCTEKSIILKKGEKLIVYTDGICELRNNEDIMYGEERLIEFINDHKEFSTDYLMKHLKYEANSWRNKEMAIDDITILCIEKTN